MKAVHFCWLSFDTTTEAPNVETMRSAEEAFRQQQALQGLHRTRSLWMATRTARVSALRGFCREFGIVIAVGSQLGVERVKGGVVEFDQRQ